MQVKLSSEQEQRLEQLRGEREQVAANLLGIKEQITSLQASETHLKGRYILLNQELTKFFEEVKATPPTPLAPEPVNVTPEVPKPNPFAELTSAVAEELAPAPAQLELVASNGGNGAPIPDRKRRNR